MEQQIYMKPSEKTHRMVKNLIIAAWLCYALAGMTVLTALFAAHPGGLLVIAVLFVMAGLFVHKLLARFMNWYFSG